MTKLVEKSGRYAESRYQREDYRIIAEGAYFHGYLDGMKDVAEATRCPKCGFLCFFPNTDGWRWCSNTKCKVGKVSADGEIVLRRQIPLKVFTHSDVCVCSGGTGLDRFHHQDGRNFGFGFDGICTQYRIHHGILQSGLHNLRRLERAYVYYTVLVERFGQRCGRGLFQQQFVYG